MLQTLTLFGTRPEAIKMAPLVKALQHHPDIDNTVCVTGQHREMLDQVLQLFDIVPDFDLNIMTAGQDLADITSKVLLRVRDTLRVIKPDLVFVHGDTTSCLAGALACFYEGIPLAHVEAGLRTWNLQAPFPEEANRCLTGKIANYHFAPTRDAKLNLMNENIPEHDIFVTGNTVIDALHWMAEKNTKTNPEFWLEIFGERNYRLFSESQRRIVLITGHRRENFGQGFIDICQSIKQLSQTYPNDLFVYPVHLNPKVRTVVCDMLSDRENIILLDPLSYKPFVWLMDRSYLILTDSGGIQEEGPALGKPVLVMRDTTERPEAISAGTVKLVGTNVPSILHETKLLMDNPFEYQKMSRAINPYGDGLASDRIIQTCLSLFGERSICPEPIKEFA